MAEESVKKTTRKTTTRKVARKTTTRVLKSDTSSVAPKGKGRKAVKALYQDTTTEDEDE